MNMYELLVLAVGLSMDAFAVAICKGLAIRTVSLKHAAWVGLWFGGFQMLMPLLGFLLAHSFAQAIASFDHWIAFLLLAVIGGNMIREALSAEEEEVSGDLSARAMLLLAIATSIDALSVGFTISEYGWLMALTAAIIIAVVTFILCMAGLRIGKKFGTQLSGKANILGGVILIGIGLEIFITGVF